MFYCGLLDKSCWAELKYARILALWGRGFELWLLKVQKNWISSIFNLTGWPVKVFKPQENIIKPVIAVLGLSFGNYNT